ncbi:MAG: PepSY domain-containing protein, partial [Nitrososphaeraceae archaeon]|nr:PepSY domain-containing protein [Nitrososphaeraceae archaeon]
MSTKDINNNKNRSETRISKNIIFGILAAGVIVAMGFTGISNISAQSMPDTTTTAAATNDSSKMLGKVNLTGTIDVDKAIVEAFKSKVTINIIDAITTAQNSVGSNSTVKEVELTEAHGYLVYKIKIIGEDMKKYKVLVDPGNGSILYQKEITYSDYDHKRMGKEMGDKY